MYLTSQVLFLSNLIVLVPCSFVAFLLVLSVLFVFSSTRLLFQVLQDTYGDVYNGVDVNRSNSRIFPELLYFSLNPLLYFSPFSNDSLIAAIQEE